MPASDDTYKGFTSGPGNDQVRDHGGTADKLDLRPLETSNVYFDTFDRNLDGTNESLRIIISDTNQAVEVVGHFAPVQSLALENGRMEQIIFANEIVTSAAELNSLM